MAPPVPSVCAVVPVFEHHVPVRPVVSALRSHGLACLLVDDGSGADCSHALAELAGADPSIRVLRLSPNQGKGAAVRAGLAAAMADGWSHALQIDADGQHALGDIPRFLAETRSHPQAVICGRPLFGPGTPRSRLYGRRLTQFWVCINTLSTDIPDAMCGFRVYPLREIADVLARPGLASRMDFDIEILVRLHWRGLPLRWLDTEISYPQGGVSHFRMGLDNVLISRVHTVLFFGMLRRSPCLIARRLSRSRPSRSAA